VNSGISIGALGRDGALAAKALCWALRADLRNIHKVSEVKESSLLDRGFSPLNFFFKNSPKIACQAPKPLNPFRTNNIQME
jgi:hypothetical protein